MTRARRGVGRATALLCVLMAFAASCSGGGDATVGTDTADTSTDTLAETRAETLAGTRAGYDWTDARRRRALSMAIDREAITTNMLLGSSAPADDWWPPTHAGYQGGNTCPNLAFNPEEARALWAEAGGNAGPVTLWYNAGSSHDEWIQAVSNMLIDNLGVEEVDFRSLEFADYLDKLHTGEVDAPFRLGWLMAYPSPGGFLGPMHTTGGTANLQGYSDPDFDALVRSGDAKPLGDAIDDYRAAADILCDDMPVAPIFFGGLQAVHSESVDGVAFDPFEAVRLDEIVDLDGDGEVSIKICEPTAGLYGQATLDLCGAEVVNALFTGLYSLQPDGDDEVDVVYDGVATSIESTDDGTNWTIKLADGWTFHDGTPVTAASFVDAWNWAALGANGAPNQQFIAMLHIDGFDEMNAERSTVTELAGLSTPDDLTIEIALDEAFPQLPLILAYNAFLPLPDAFFDDPAAFGEEPIGNGPFMIDGSWQHDVEIATVAYPDYRGRRPTVESVVYRIYADDATAYNDVIAGQLDVLDRVPVARLGTFAEEFPGRHIERPTPAMVYLGFPLGA